FNNVGYNYDAKFGGIIYLNPQTLNSHPIIFSYNNQGDTVFRKQISYDSLSSPGPDVSVFKVVIDSIGNRHLFGNLMDWNVPNVTMFELRLDSLGNTISNQYWPSWHWWMWGSNRVSVER